MKKIKLLLLPLITLLLIISCNEENENTPDEKETVANVALITNSKWNIDGTNAYKSIEFNTSGNYIIT